MLLLRHGAPSAAIWRGETTAVPRFVLNLVSFHDAEAGFDAATFGEGVETAVIALTLSVPSAARIAVGFADLAGLLARLGIGYGSVESLGIARALAMILRGRAEAASGAMARNFGAIAPTRLDWPASAGETLLPGLAEVARAAHSAASNFDGLRHTALTAITAPGTEDALLGVETGGIAPAFSPLDETGALTRTARAWLAAKGVTPEAALAEALAGGDPLPLASAADYVAMHDAVAPLVQAMPARPEPVRQPQHAA